MKVALLNEFIYQKLPIKFCLEGTATVSATLAVFGTIKQNIKNRPHLKVVIFLLSPLPRKLEPKLMRKTFFKNVKIEEKKKNKDTKQDPG